MGHKIGGGIWDELSKNKDEAIIISISWKKNGGQMNGEERKVFDVAKNRRRKNHPETKRG